MQLSYVPSWCTIIALSSIVVSLTMTAHEQDLVHSVEVRVSVQRVNNLSESLPLGGIANTRARINLVYEAKVDRSLHRSVRSILSKSATATYVIKA